MPPPFSRAGVSGKSRMTANPAKPVQRYRPGKAVAEEASESEEDDSYADEGGQVAEEGARRQAAVQQPKVSSFPARAGARPKHKVEEESDEEGFITEEEEGGGEEDGDESPAPSISKAAPAATMLGSVWRAEGLDSKADPKPEDSGKEEDGEEEDEDESSGEEESSSEDEAPQRKLLRPTFIKKSDRNSNGSTATGPRTTIVSQTSGSDSKPIPPPSVAGQMQAKPMSTSEEPGVPIEDSEAARRRALADLMITDKLERDAIARAQGRKSWDDDEEVAPEDTVDDTDGLDPEAEHAAWRLRELRRLKRDRETIEAREKEIEEIERRRNLTTEEREREDNEFLEKQREDRESGRGKAGYMQRYHHKGAFFKGDSEFAAELAQRDLMGAKFVDEVKNREALPEYMQVRDMTKLGKKGRTRYKDLKSEDTGRWADFGRVPRKDREGRALGNTADDRFKPDDDRGGGRDGPTGANAGALGHRREQERRIHSSAPGGPQSMRERDERDERDDAPARRRSTSRSRSRRRQSYSRSRSRSPPPSRPRRRRRSQSPPPRSRSRSRSPPRRRYRDDYAGGDFYRDRDKRRRVDGV